MSDTHPDFDPNIRIKQEPTIESQASAETGSASLPLIANIKLEPQQITNLVSTPPRLTSFRPPRDLNLIGGNFKLEKPKKNYTPNVSARRLKNRDDPTSSSKNDSLPKDNKNQNKDKGKTDRDKNKDRNKSRLKPANNLVQSTGIFSEGLADLSLKKYGTRSGSSGSYRGRESGGGTRETATLERPKLSIPTKIDKTEEAEKLKALLRDDFIEDELEEIDWTREPVALPLGSLNPEFVQSINIHSEDKKKDIVQNGEAKIKNKFVSPQIKKEGKKVSPTVSQIMENLPNNFVLIQLPDCLPGHQKDESPSNQKSKRIHDQNTENENDKFCRLKSLNEGLLGKIQILKSGKARLKLGENNLLIQPRFGPSFRQDLITAQISADKKNGEIINIGTVNSSLVLTPDWINMLKNT